MNDLRLLLQADKDRKIINLEFKQISNLGLMMPILSKFQNLETLSLNGNRLQGLPSDMGTLEKLIELDISNNLFKDVGDILPSLKTLPRLSHLMYSLKNDEEQSLIERQLPNMQRLNKKPINTNFSTKITKKHKERSQTMKLNQKDLEDIAVIYDDIREVYRRNKYFVDKELADQFDKGVDNIMGELSIKLNSSAVEEEVNTSIVGCRYALIDLCFVKLITYFYHLDRNIASILERIHDNVAESFKQMNDILKSSMDRSKAQIANVSLKKQQLYKTEIRRLKKIQQQHLTQISNLETKNAELLDKITKNSKKDILQTSINSIIKRKTKSPGQGGTPLKNRSSNQPIDTSELALKLNKSLTLHQLKQTMNQIYFSKSKHNSICIESGTPMETLQTHMYTFFNQKYGLKPITVQWAMSIVNGIKKYGHEDAEVAAFGKMLRNELEEEFNETLLKIKSSVRLATRKFKGEDPQNISTNECQEILLTGGYKRDVITTIMSKVNPQRMPNGLINPSQLQQLVLDFILRKHCDKLKGATTVFKQVDTDEDGIINHEQLYVFVEKLNIQSQIDADDLSNAIDPLRTNIITYSHLLQCMQKMAVFKDLWTK